MPIQTRSSHKKHTKGKEQTFTYQYNPFYVKDPLTDIPSSSSGPIFGEPKSPTIHETEYNDGNKNDRNIPENYNDSSSSSEIDEAVEPPEKEILDCQKGKDFRKMMKTIMTREKEDYFLQLANQGAKLPIGYDVQTLVTKRKDSAIIMVHKQLLAL